MIFSNHIRELRSVELVDHHGPGICQSELEDRQSRRENVRVIAALEKSYTKDSSQGEDEQSPKPLPEHPASVSFGTTLRMHGSR